MAIVDSNPGQQAVSTPTFIRIARYLLKRLLVVAFTLVVGIYISVIVANLGGYIDDITRDRIESSILGRIQGGWLEDVKDQAEANEIIENTRLEMEAAAGLNQPFLLRCLRWTWQGLTFQIFDRQLGDSFPNTLLLFGTASFFLFFACLGLALLLSRNYGSLLDRLVVSLSPVSSMPSWVHGVILVIIFAIQLRWLPYNVTISPAARIIDGFKYGFDPAHVLLILKHMALPVASVFMSMFFQLTYTWRTFFLIYAHEDYVDIARAKGLPPRQIEQRYILRPTLPYILTSFSLVLISFWQTSMVLEIFFYWPGIGVLYLQSLRVWAYNPTVVMGVVTIFAYILALTVLVLDIVYALVDPRIRIDAPKPGRQVQAYKDRLRSIFGWLKRPACAPAQRLASKDRLPPFHLPARSTPNGRASTATRRSAQARLVLLETIRHPLRLVGVFGSFSLFALSLGVYAYNPTTVIGIATVLSYSLALTFLTLFIVFPMLEARSMAAPPLRKARAYNWWNNQALPTLREVTRYPSAVVGVFGILFLLTISVITVIKMPFKQVHTLWVSNAWAHNPVNAPPAWTNLLRSKKLPVTINLNSQDGSAQKTVEAASATGEDILLSFGFDFPYDDFPQEIILEFDADYKQKRPHVSLAWITPDGRELDLGTVSMTSSTRVYFSQDAKIKRRAGGVYSPEVSLFTDPAQDTPVPLKGRYELRIYGLTFEEGADLDAEMVVVGKLFGWAGTDHRRRDLSLALLWGLPIALALGFFGAICTTVVSIVVAALGAWFGGWVDSLVQAVTEINIMLPVFPVSVMAYFMYGKNVWFVVGAIILFSILGSSTKNYRAAFLQIKDSPYIESARAYGAGNWRIITRYLAPRIVPVMVPQLVAMVPGYVFLEATLSILGVSDPYIPTWGNVIYDALAHGAFRGYYYWIIEPIGLLLVTALAFALVGFALDRVFNPRLRSL